MSCSKISITANKTVKPHMVRMVAPATSTVGPIYYPRVQHIDTVYKTFKTVQDCSKYSRLFWGIHFRAPVPLGQYADITISNRFAAYDFGQAMHLRIMVFDPYTIQSYPHLPHLSVEQRQKVMTKRYVILKDVYVVPATPVFEVVIYKDVSV